MVERRVGTYNRRKMEYPYIAKELCNYLKVSDSISWEHVFNPGKSI